MHSIVKQLRADGERLKAIHISRDRGYLGNLVLSSREGKITLDLYTRGSGSTPVKLLPTLYFAECVAMGSTRMLWIGFERLGYQAGEYGKHVMQEWSCEIVQSELPKVGVLDPKKVLS